MSGADAGTVATSNSKKRSHEISGRVRRRKRPRVKHSPFSSTSEPSISGDSALIPTSVSDESTDPSEVDQDSESELSESSEEPSSDSSSEDESDEDSELEAGEEDDEDKVTNLRANRGKKPKMRLKEEEMGPDIRSFLQDFLPQLKAANDELEVERQAGTLKDMEIDGENGSEDGEQYIEMNLGLGVLEERNSKDPESSSESSNGSDAEVQPKEKDIMGKLLGRDARTDAGIQEVGKVENT